MPIVQILMLAAGAVVPASASSRPAVAHAVDCFLAIQSLADSRDPKVRAMGKTGAMFFAGQIFGADPRIDLGKVATAEALTLSEARIAELRLECGRELQARGQQMESAGAAMRERIRAQSPD